MLATDNRIPETRRTIMNAYAALMREKSSAHITICDLIKEAHISRSTFYRNYNNINDVLMEMENIIIQDLTNTASVQRQTPHRREMADTPSYANYFQARTIYAHKDWIRALAGPNGDPCFRGKMTRLIKKQHASQFAGVENGDFFLEFLSNGFCDLIFYWLEKRPDLSYIEFFHLLYDMPSMLTHVFHEDNYSVREKISNF